MWQLVIVFIYITGISASPNLVDLAFQQNANQIISIKNYVFWPNATVPFYVNPEHFDHEQSLAILTAVSMFAFKSCLKFAPVMAPPAPADHALVFENSAGVRRCVLDSVGRSVYEPHSVTLGYDCLQSPQIDMMIMKALGFPFEHNRINRGIYIEVLGENIEPGFTEFFTKDATQPIELRAIPYDVNSVMHFGIRDYSKNGHRTILFKDHTVQQNRVGLTKLDLRKIETVYGPECRARDRQEKIELCQTYPGVARKKRDIFEHSTPNPRLKREAESSGPVRRKRDDSIEVTQSLRVNPEITPPPDTIKDTLKKLGIEAPVQEIVDQVNKISALALRNAREKYCNVTQSNLRSDDNEKIGSDIMGVVDVIANYAHGLVENAVGNLTQFCEDSESMQVYQRARCSWNDGSERCRPTYRSTKSGPVKHSTQHRPTYIQSTKHSGSAGNKYRHYEPMYRASNDSEVSTEVSRRKRETEDTKIMDNDNVEINLQNKTQNDTKDNEDEDGKAVRSETTLLERRNLYEPVRRSQRRDRERYAKDDFGDSSVSAEKVRPRKKHKQLNTEGRFVTKKMRKEKHVKVKHDRQKEREEFGKSKQLKQREKEEYEEAKHDRKREGEVFGESKHVKQREKEEYVEAKHDRQREEEFLEAKHVKHLEKKEYAETKHGRQRKEEEFGETKHGKQQKREEFDEDLPVRQREREEHSEEKLVRNQESEEKDSESSSEELKLGKVEEKRHKNKRPRIDNDKMQDGHEILHRVVKLSPANEEFYKDRRWPGGVVRYVIQEDTTYDTNDLRRRLQEVNDILMQKTCVQLREITEEQAKSLEDYIVIDNSQDYVTGRVGGRQSFGSIELFRGGQHVQHTAMMALAMLGFYFEVSRHDRDQYVRVHMRHVRPDKLHHFEKIREDATLPLPYDYKSATHPAWQFWRHVGRTGISTVATYKQQDPDGSIMSSLGQNPKLLSDIDIVKINSVYGIKCFRNARSEVK